MHRRKPKLSSITELVRLAEGERDPLVEGRMQPARAVDIDLAEINDLHTDCSFCDHALEVLGPVYRHYGGPPQTLPHRRAHQMMPISPTDDASSGFEED